MMPLRLDLHDPMGRAMSGQVPRPINAAGADRVFDPSVGEIYYWPPSSDIGIVDTDLDQSLSPPGLVRLGAVSSGLDEIAAAGNWFTVWVDRADRIGTWSNDRADQPLTLICNPPKETTDHACRCQVRPR
jgi:hypothetical protein